MKLPKVDDVRKKARAIEGAKNVTLKEEDIEQVVMIILLGPAQRPVIYIDGLVVRGTVRLYKRNKSTERHQETML